MKKSTKLSSLFQSFSTFDKIVMKEGDFIKQIIAGIVASVDAGKTTLSEALMYQAGKLAHLGRVDKGESFLDTTPLEKKRGITIFSHQANLTFNNLALTLLDTPGHLDFAIQTEEVLSILDYAILVLSSKDLVTSQSKKIWQLLTKYHVPTFIFVNKMDLTPTSKDELLKVISSELNAPLVDFSNANFKEEAAYKSEMLLETYLETETITDQQLQAAIFKSEIIPCYFGSALKMDGIKTFCSDLAAWTKNIAPTPSFSARVFKITHDSKGERLTWLRLYGGQLNVRDQLLEGQKINQIRLYDGESFKNVSTFSQGVCAVTGLTASYSGQGLGEIADLTLTQAPVMTYRVNTNGNDFFECLKAFQELNDEDPSLNLSWSQELQELSLQVMGKMQLDVLQDILHNRYHLDIDFDQGSILYQETITQPIEAVGHFEPLRHYAEVHLLLEPLPHGSGLQFASTCSLDDLAINWQKQIISHLKAKKHRGVLGGYPLTDVKITLVTGKSHLKHTEGGDFYQASCRAVRQGLMALHAKNACELLEPWYQFTLETPLNLLGKAMTDIVQLGGSVDQTLDQTISGKVPVATIQTYLDTFRAYTHGQGQIDLTLLGYLPCHDQDVLKKLAYQPESDLENTPQSVFCAHGAGFTVNWQDVPKMMHCAYVTPYH